MSLLPYYNTGTISVTNGDATVTGSGTNFLLANLQAGDRLWIPGEVDYFIESITDATHLELLHPWQGSTDSGLTYYIFRDGLARFSGLYQAQQWTDLNARIGNAIVYRVLDAEPDNGIGEDDSLAIKVSGGSLSLWVKEAGDWGDPLSLSQSFADLGSILDDGGNELLIFGVTASAVNNFKISNAATGNAPLFSVIGNNSNIDARYATKGVGEHIFQVNAIDELKLSATALYPHSDGGLDLGTSAKGYSTLFIASGGAIKFNNTDVTLTHASNLLTLAGGDLKISSAKLNIEFNSGGSAGTATPNGILIHDLSNGGAWDVVNPGAAIDFSSADTTTLGAGVRFRVGMRMTAAGGGSSVLSIFGAPTAADTLSEYFSVANSGAIGVAGAPGSAASITCGGASQGSATTSHVVHLVQTAGSSNTTAYNGILSALSTAAASFTVTSLRHFYATQGTIGAGSAITNQYGFAVDSGLTGATNNFGFWSNIASGSNRWNFYAAGSAQNLFAGITSFTSSQAASSVSTGAIVVTGGAGIGGALYVGGIGRLTDSTASTSTSTGALVVTGGVGIGGALYATTIAFGDGTNAAPGACFGLDTDTGLYRIASNKLAFATGGNFAFAIDSGGRFLKGLHTSISVGGNHVGMQIHDSGSGAGMAQVRFQANSSGPAFNLGKSRGSVGSQGAAPTYGAISAADDLGYIRFCADIGNSNVDAIGAEIRVTNDGGTPTTTSLPTKFEIRTTPSGSVAPTTRVTWYSTGGQVNGGATGGDKGTGTINAVGVYDDNALLTCFGVEYLIDGAIDLSKWDGFAPHGYHQPAHAFVDMVGPDFDPRDHRSYFAKMNRDRALPGMPSQKEWRHNALSVGEFVNCLWLSQELQVGALMSLSGDVDRLSERERELTAELVVVCGRMASIESRMSH